VKANGAASPHHVQPFPAWHGGSAAERERWQKARRAWQENIRAYSESLANGGRGHADARTHRESGLTRDADRGRQAERRPGALARHAGASARQLATGTTVRSKGISLTERVRRFQKHVISNGLVMFMLFVINAATGGFPWFIFPWVAMSIGMAAHAFSLWQDGVGFRDVFRRPSRLAELEAPAGAAEPREAEAVTRARALVGDAVYNGPHGGAVQRAVEDEQAVQVILKSLPPADLAQLPDVEPTLRSLVERVASIAQALQTLDNDVNPGHVARLEARIREARSLPEGAADRERRISLLERQRTSLTELIERRAKLADQLESATLVLQTMRLDLLRLRSSGIGNVAADLSSVTQEARAVSRDIGRVLDAAAEVRKL
jgi:serine/threonine-protein kinase